MLRLSWREQPKSVLPSAHGKSCCSRAAALVSFGLLLWCPCRSTAGCGMVPQGLSQSLEGAVWLSGLEVNSLPDSHGVELAEFCESWEMEWLQTPLPGDWEPPLPWHIPRAAGGWR